MSEYYTCDEIAIMYKVKKITVWEWIRLKKLSAIKIGKEYRIRPSDLENFEKSRETVNPNHNTTENTV